MQSVLARKALPVVLALMTICPALGVLLTGRDISTFEALEPLAPSALALLVLRLGTLAALGAMLAAIASTPGLGLTTSARPRQLALLGAFLLFFLTNYVVPAVFGAVPSLGLRAYPYTFLLFVALYAARDQGSEGLIAGAKWSLLAVMVASLVLAVVWPKATLRPYADELRLPLVPFRFWGLGSGPNSIGPLALVLLLLLIVQPFERRWLQALALLSAGVVGLLAQSQTAWMATLLIVPPLLVYRRRLVRLGRAPLAPPLGLGLVVLGLVGAALVVFADLAAEAPHQRVFPTGGIAGGSDLLTGRGSIWRVALDVFAAHPLFGYGLTIWEDDFRARIGMSFAVHAHNQAIQSLSMAGIVGAAGLAVYVAVLVRASVRLAAPTGGLAPALMVLTLLRMITEVPLQMQTLLVGDALMHALLFGVLVASYGTVDATARAASPWQSAPLLRSAWSARRRARRLA